MNENELSYEIIAATIEVHRTLGGPGLLEDMYEEALKFELEQRGLQVRCQVAFKVVYKGNELDKRLVIDLLVNDVVIVEAKAVTEYHAIYESQVLTYLRQTKISASKWSRTVSIAS